MIRYTGTYIPFWCWYGTSLGRHYEIQNKFTKLYIDGIFRKQFLCLAQYDKRHWFCYLVLKTLTLRSCSHISCSPKHKCGLIGLLTFRSCTHKACSPTCVNMILLDFWLSDLVVIKHALLLVYMVLFRSCTQKHALISQIWSYKILYLVNTVTIYTVWQ